MTRSPHSSRASAQTRPRLTALTAAILAGLMPLAGAQTAPVSVLPRGGSVSAGQATIGTPNGNRLDIQQNSQRAVLRWDSFSIGAGGVVNFSQPNAQAATLNVITGPLGSEIAGTLKANGSVFLINPQGIAITATGLVDTRAGFVASTLGLSDDDFMAGRLRFNGRGGNVLNQGRIVTGEGGQVALLGGRVENDGLILAPLGKVALGSASAATLDFSGDGFLQVMLPADAVDGDSRPLIGNGGRIEAGMVALRASTVREALREAIHLPGTIRATTLSGVDGSIVLDGGAGGTVHVSGTLDASSATAGGGRIDVTGHDVALAGATLDASGATRGGLVRVGGAFQGGRADAALADTDGRYLGRFGVLPVLAAANRVGIDADSRIDVSARGAQGLGGTAIVWSTSATRMLGRLDAHGAAAGGAVEISSASTVQAVALDRLLLGRGARLLLDPQDIVIGDAAAATPPGDIGFNDNPGGTTTLNSGDLASLLGAGVDVRLQASQDITWSTFFTGVSRGPGGAAAGDLTLAAGRSVVLSGAFSNGGGHWTITANDTAAHGVIDAERGAGLASLDLRNANFITDNGPLTLLLADGAGNTERSAGSLRLGAFAGESLSATVMPTASSGVGMPVEIVLGGNISVAGSATLSGALKVSGASRIDGHAVDWTTEATDSIVGEGVFRFVEDGVVTRLARLGGVDATRVALGNNVGGAVTRVYGDADPDAEHLGRAPVHQVGGPAATLDGLFMPGSLTVSGPGVTANAGSGTLTLSGTGAAAFDPSVLGNFFVDMRSATMPLTITRRTLTPTVSAGNYVYGAPASVVSLAGIVNGDSVAPIATLGGQGGVAMTANGGGYGFGERVGAGGWNFSLTGLGGTAASNYAIDLSGSVSASLTIAPKPVSFFVGNAAQTYGTASALPISVLAGVLSGDDVNGVVGLSSGGSSVLASARLAAGSYAASVTTLAGAAASNYVLAVSGNTDGVFRVDPKALTWSVADAGSTYGTLATLGVATLGGVLAGDVVTGTVAASADGSTPFTLAANTRAGNYAEIVTGLGGAQAGNYTLAVGGNATGRLVVAPKTITYVGGSIDQIYGQTLQTPGLVGLLAGDTVVGTQRFDVVEPRVGIGSSSAWPVGHYVTSVAGLTGADAGNYVLAVSGNSALDITVKPKPLTYVATGGGNVYGSSPLAGGPVLSGIVGADQVEALPTVDIGGSPQFLGATTRAGTYTFGATTASLNGAAAGNYVIAASGNTPASWIVSPKPLTWSVSAGNAIYGDVPTVAGNGTSLSGVLPGDSVGAVLAALDGGGAVVARPSVGGTWWAGVNALTGADAGNYTLAGSGNAVGALTVTPRPVSFSTASANSVYGNLATLGAVTLGNVLAGDSVGYSTALLSGATPVALTDRTHAGVYVEAVTAITGNPNYVLATNGNSAGTLTVQPRPISYIAQDASGTYGTAPTLGAASLLGVLSGDAVSAGPAVLTATGAAPTDRTNAGHWTLGLRSLTGADASNYVATDVGSTTATLTVAPKVVTVTVDGYFQNVRYSTIAPDGSFSTFNPSYGMVSSDLPIARGSVSGLLSGDQVSVVTSVSPMTRSSSGALNVGTYTMTGTGLTGADAGNYVMAGSGNRGATLTVSPIAITGTAWLQGPNGLVNLSTYGSSDLYSFRSALSNELRPGDQVSVDAWLTTPAGNVTTAPARLPVGSYATSGVLQGADAGNYTMRPSFGAFVVQPKPVTVTTPDTTSTYGDVPRMPTSIVNGVLSGDQVGALTSLFDPVSLWERTPSGRYPVRVDGLGGADASNYVIAPGNLIVPGLPASNTGYINVLKREIGRSLDSGSLDIIYGGGLPALHLTTGILPGDEVNLGTVAVATQLQGRSVGPGYEYAIDDKLNVGSYLYVARLSGRDAANYFTASGSTGIAVITVAPKPVTVSIDAINTIYGTYVAPTVSVSGLIRNDALWVKPDFHVVNNAGEISYGDRTAAGDYLQVVLGLRQEGRQDSLIDFSRNYRFVSTNGATAPLSIARKALGFTPATAASIYGNVATLGVLTGVLSGDDVGVRVDAGGKLQSLPAGKGNDPLTYAPRLDAGDYGWTASLTGAQSTNYVASPIGGTLTVAPRPITYGIIATGYNYGGYVYNCTRSGCTPWGLPVGGGVNLGRPTFENVLPGDEVNGTVGLVDFAGNALAAERFTHVGQYFKVVTGLTGAAAKNYRVADSGSLPGLLTISPMQLSYSVTSAIFFNELVGTPGIATLRGPDGPFSGPDVHPVVTAYDPQGRPVSDLSHLVPGRYVFRVTGLTGADAKDFEIISPYYGGYPYVTNDPGTLDVFTSAMLGGSFSDTAQRIPTIPPLPQPAPTVVAPPLTGWSSNKTGQIEDFGRNITGTGTAGDVTIGPRGGAVSGTASGVVETGVTVGGVDLSTQASGEVSGLAKFGITGVKLEANVNGHVDVTITSGPGYVTFGAQGEAYAIGNLGRNGLQIAAEARAGATAQTGVSGNISGLGDARLSTTVSTFVFARADEQYTVRDGRVVQRFDNAVGVGSSAGIAAGVSGSTGSVGGGATVYTPGSIGGTFNYSIGISDGAISVSLDLGAQLGFGGLGLSLNFSINPMGLAEAMTDNVVGRAVLGVFGLNHSEPDNHYSAADSRYAASITDAAARFKYLDENSRWRDRPWNYMFDEGVRKNWDSMQAFYNSYRSMISRTQALIKKEQADQVTFLNLLKTDPQAAIAMAHNTDFAGANQREEAALRGEANSFGVQLAVVDGKVTYVSPTRP
ncbi:beta strand repeat-containing protein [Roseateles sp. L2-2]|uniref:beta strand repeat-containing protein n=1 Tax=Roseateles sp. L2-2 TaxID=3422597 RepID=UPI003D35EA36